MHWAERSLRLLRSVPEHVLFDNTKAVVIERDAYRPGLHRWNDEMRELAEACGFTCRPYPGQDQGKVEHQRVRDGTCDALTIIDEIFRIS